MGLRTLLRISERFSVIGFVFFMIRLVVSGKWFVGAARERRPGAIAPLPTH